MYSEKYTMGSVPQIVRLHKTDFRGVGIPAGQKTQIDRVVKNQPR